ncbi:hypothetical protein DKL61_06820 [Gammaproteobacteria bacterium ESL0073]|nr:hypothetical protein DKL61_06820 [Gammaproteobacteria bacterium ESL0073]
MLTALSFILVTYIVTTVIALVIRKKNNLPWGLFFLFNIAISIGYVVLSLTILEEIISLPALKTQGGLNYLELNKSHLSILTICLLGIVNAFISLGLFVFFIFRETKDF